MSFQGVKRCLRRWSRVLLSELIATALLVWLGCLSSVSPGQTGRGPVTNVAMAFGLLVAGNMCAFGEASGAHMNPALTLGALLYNRLDPVAALMYVVAQLTGATLGFTALTLTMPKDLISNVGVTLPGAGVSAVSALLVEAAITAVLMLTTCSVWGVQPRDSVGAIKIGLTVTGLIYAAWDVSGAALNPARAFAPALVQGLWDYHWVYWAGPLGGATLAVLLHRFVLTARGTEQVGTQI